MADDYDRYRHSEKRLNNPPVGLVTPARDGEERNTKYAYDPHIAPCLEFDSGRAAVEKLLNQAPAEPRTEEEREQAKQEREAFAAALKAAEAALSPEDAAILRPAWTS